MSWALLCGAIVSEVAATLSLRMASRGHRIFYPLVSTGYILAFGLLTIALRHGLPLGIAYGIWSAAGVALTALLSRLLFREPLTRTMAVGIALIMVGVLLIEWGAQH